jgi:hypothetical protein
MATAPPRLDPTTDDHSRLVFVELGPGDPDSRLEILVGQLRVDDLVAVLGQVSWFNAAWDRLPAVKEQNFHWIILAAASAGRHTSASEHAWG